MLFSFDFSTPDTPNFTFAYVLHAHMALWLKRCDSMHVEKVVYVYGIQDNGNEEKGWKAEQNCY